CLVLEEPREEEVPGLEQREVLLVLHFGLRQQPRSLEIQEGRGDEQERGGLLQVPAAALRRSSLDVSDELVGDLGERDLGDIELVLGDQLQQQVERPLEVVELDLEAGLGLGHESLNRCTSWLSSPCASRSARASATAWRT